MGVGGFLLSFKEGMRDIIPRNFFIYFKYKKEEYCFDEFRPNRSWANLSAISKSSRLAHSASESCADPDIETAWVCVGKNRDAFDSRIQLPCNPSLNLSLLATYVG